MILGGFPEQLWRSRLKRSAFLILAFAALATNIARAARAAAAGSGGGDPGVRAGRARRERSGPAAGRQPRLSRRLGAEQRFGPLRRPLLAPCRGRARSTALSDDGTLFRFALPAGARRASRSASIRSRDGPGPATRKSNRDTESMVILGPSLWAGFERHNMIWRYRRADLARRRLGAARADAGLARAIRGRRA